MPGGVAFYGSENSRVRVRFTSSTDWFDVPGAASYREEGGKKPIREVPAFQGVGSKSGKARPPEIIVNVVYAPHSQVMKDINNVYKKSTLLDLEYYVPGDVIYTGSDGASEIAIAVTGVVTFSGTGKIPIVDNPLLEPGLVIEQDDKFYPIDTIVKKSDDSYELKVRPVPAKAIDATHEFTIRLDHFSRGPVKAEVTQSGYIEADSESNITSVCSFQPRVLLPEIKRGLSV